MKEYDEKNSGCYEQTNACENRKTEYKEKTKILEGTMKVSNDQMNACEDQKQSTMIK
jgi:hypothetical protein